MPRLFGSIEEDVGQYDDEQEIFWASGVAFFSRKEIFTQLGGFDEAFFAYAEENDLCFKARRAGYKVLYFPKTEVWHLGGFTSNQNMAQKIFLIHRNHLALLLKNFKKRELAIILPTRFLMDLGAIIYYFFTFKSTKNALAVIKAYLSLVINLRSLVKRRLDDKIGNFGYNQPNLRCTHSVVWSYFFCKKRRYGELFTGKRVSSEVKRLF